MSTLNRRDKSHKSGRHKLKSEVADSEHEWSEWDWDPQVDRWCRFRLAENGRYEYEFNTRSQFPSVTTPRVTPEESTQPTTIAQSHHRQDELSYQNEAVPPTSLDKSETKCFYPASPPIPFSYTSFDGDEIDLRIRHLERLSTTPVTSQPLPILPTLLDGDEVDQRIRHLERLSTKPVTSQPLPILPTSLDGDEVDRQIRHLERLSTTLVTPQPLPVPSTSLDERYQVISHPSRFFKIGRVFKVLWTEPAGNVSESNCEFVIPTKFGEMAFTKIRPFVVIREMQGCCLCLPLSTFSHQGTEKDRIRAGDYSAVYPMGSNPQIKTFEKMTKQAFPIIIEDPKERIDPMSRLNFGQVHTIQHNLKVFRIGRIPDEHLALLNKYFLESIAGTPAQGTTSVSMAFRSLPLGPDEKVTSDQDAAEEDVRELAAKYNYSYNLYCDNWPGPSQSDNYLGTDYVPQYSYSSPSTRAAVSNGYYPEISNNRWASTPYPYNQTNYAKKSSESDAQIPIPDTVKMTKITPDETGKLNAPFKIHTSKEFKPGRVFKVIWSEPIGDSGKDMTSTSSIKLVIHNEETYSSLRRFVIFAADQGYSQCLPILTYGRKGTAKAGVKREDHAIIYTTKRPPKTLPGELPLSLAPIQVIPKTSREELAPESRINYGKIYTVEHNLKVMFIGKIANPSQNRFVADFNSTWSRKQKLDSFPKDDDNATKAEFSVEDYNARIGYSYIASKS